MCVSLCFEPKMSKTEDSRNTSWIAVMHVRKTVISGDNCLWFCYYKRPPFMWSTVLPNSSTIRLCVPALKTPQRWVNPTKSLAPPSIFLALVWENPAWKSSLRSQLRVWLSAWWGGCDHRAASVQKNRQDTLTTNAPPHRLHHLLPLTPTPSLPEGRRGSPSRPSCGGEEVGFTVLTDAAPPQPLPLACTLGS